MLPTTDGLLKIVGVSVNDLFHQSKYEEFRKTHPHAPTWRSVSDKKRDLTPRRKKAFIDFIAWLFGFKLPDLTAFIPIGSPETEPSQSGVVTASWEPALAGLKGSGSSRQWLHVEIDRLARRSDLILDPRNRGELLAALDELRRDCGPKTPFIVKIAASLEGSNLPIEKQFERLCCAAILSNTLYALCLVIVNCWESHEDLVRGIMPRKIKSQLRRPAYVMFDELRRLEGANYYGVVAKRMFPWFADPEEMRTELRKWRKQGLPSIKRLDAVIERLSEHHGEAGFDAEKAWFLFIVCKALDGLYDYAAKVEAADPAISRLHLFQSVDELVDAARVKAGLKPPGMAASSTPYSDA